MYKSLQAGRAIAAILVVLFHLGGTIAKEKYFGIEGFNIPFLFGGAGVEFFFVLSGFIILTAHKSDLFQPNKFFTYLKKRVFRVYPVYWMFFFAVYILAIQSGSFHSNLPNDALTLLKSLFLIPQHKIEMDSAGNALAVVGNNAPVISVAWTLQYEMFFYLLFAALILNKWLFIILATMLAYMFMAYRNVEVDSFSIWFLSQPYILLFFMGMMVSYLCVIKNIAVTRTSPYIALGAALFFTVALDTVCGFSWFSGQQTLLYGVASSLIIFWLVQKEHKNCVVGGNKWLQLLGDSSYALYLIHNPLISVLCKVFLLLHFDQLGVYGALISYAVIFAACLGSAIIFHLWVEAPVSRWLARTFLAKKATPIRLQQKLY